MTLAGGLVLFGVGAIASGINSVAGGGTLVSFPTLIGMGPSLGMPIASLDKVANATNSVGLWPGSLAGGFGFWNLIQKTAPYLRTLLLPTILGAAAGSFLLLATSNATFKVVIPVLIFLAAALLLFQKRVRDLVRSEHGRLPVWAGISIQFLVSLYGGYFGAGMGIMMLAAFALYMEGTIHELNAVKSWLSLLINLVASVIFIAKGLVALAPALILASGALVGGYAAARLSQRVDPEKLRIAIAIYGFAMSAYFVWRAYH
jgi:uncharacterized membrane protein YfcA